MAASDAQQGARQPGRGLNVVAINDYHPGQPLPDKAGHHSRGRLERVLRSGQFAVTAELAPPDSALAEDVYERASVFDGYVDGMNATDGSGAHCHMSSVAMCALLTNVGYSPVMQISCRDKNLVTVTLRRNIPPSVLALPKPKPKAS